MRAAVRVGLVLALAGCAHAPGGASSRAEGAVLAVLADQQAAWNRGDVRGFMDGYEHTGAVVFTSGGRVQRGYEATLRRYLASYPDRAAMGTLALESIEVTPLGDAGALAWGHWRLERAGGPAGGVFTLVFRRGPEGWRIIHDHTSSSAPAPPASAQP